MSSRYKGRIRKAKGYWLVQIVDKKYGVVVKPFPVTNLRKAIVAAIIAPRYYSPNNWY